METEQIKSLEDLAKWLREKKPWLDEAVAEELAPGFASGIFSAYFEVQSIVDKLIVETTAPPPASGETSRFAEVDKSDVSEAMIDRYWDPSHPRCQETQARIEDGSMSAIDGIKDAFIAGLFTGIAAVTTGDIEIANVKRTPIVKH